MNELSAGPEAIPWKMEKWGLSRVMRLTLFLGGLAPASIAAVLSMQSNQAGEPVPEGKLTTPYRVEVIARNLQVPWAMIFLPDRRMLFTERTGAVRVLHDDPLVPEPALTIDVAQGNKMGMLGLVADPHFARNHFVYLTYNYRSDSLDPLHTKFRMPDVRCREEKDKLVAPLTLIEDIPVWSNHTGGRMRFAADGAAGSGRRSSSARR